MAKSETTDAQREARITERLRQGHPLSVYDGNFLLRQLMRAREELGTEHRRRSEAMEWAE